MCILITKMFINPPPLNSESRQDITSDLVTTSINRYITSITHKKGLLKKMKRYKTKYIKTKCARTKLRKLIPTKHRLNLAYTGGN